ncbi:MAG: hypothetical protein Q8R01_02220, partial [Ramlibacter sp.]|nr:hypothetical protein [Ramlibacter sp.]
QVCGTDVLVSRSSSSAVAADAAVTFRFGKGAAFWGPYTVHAQVSLDVARRLRETSVLAGGNAMFAPRDQAAAAAALKSAGFGLRSVRRGALVHLASLGVDDAALQLRSGHKRRDTLLRYLGWGVHSSSARQAAQDVGPIVGGAAPAEIDPAKMGTWSGFCGVKGRRIARPPPFLPLSPPSSRDLGLAPAPADTNNWPLHVKDVRPLDWAPILQLARGTALEADVARAREWCVSPRFLGASPGPVDEHRIPFARLSAAHVRTLLAAGKLQPHFGPVAGWSSGWLLPQPAKMRLRPIFEPSSNRTCAADALPTLQYPSRRERQAAMRGMPFSAEFDFSAWFDQFGLGEGVRRFFVLRVRDGVDGCSLFALSRLPMGARFAPGVAQTVTWLLVLPLLSMADVVVHTMIDNVRIAARSRRAYDDAARIFLSRVRAVGAALNDGPPADPTRPLLFLGEQYVAGERVANSEANLQKLAAAHALFAAGGAFSVRNFAALVGLVFFLAHTVGERLADHHTLLRAYSRICSDALQHEGWDGPLRFVSPAVRAEIDGLVALLLRNTPVPLPVLRPPTYNNDDYDFVIVVDASATGWGAVVQRTADHSVLQLRQTWPAQLQHSATAEPRAVSRVFGWLREALGVGISAATAARIAVVTDHDAMARGQRRWCSGFGGFSLAHALNEAFRAMHGPHLETEVFYVPGECNIADGPSRDPTPATAIDVRSVALVFPSLAGCHHPYAAIDRPAHMV